MFELRSVRRVRVASCCSEMLCLYCRRKWLYRSPFCGFGYDNLWVLVSAAHCRYCWRQSVRRIYPAAQIVHSFPPLALQFSYLLAFWFVHIITPFVPFVSIVRLMPGSGPLWNAADFPTVIPKLPPPRFHDRVHCLVSEAFAVPRTNRCRDRRRPFELRSVAR